MAIVHNYPKETEFIYKNKIIVQDATSKQQAKLQERLGVLTLEEQAKLNAQLLKTQDKNAKIALIENAIKEKEKTKRLPLYIGIGVFVLVLGVATFVLLRRKKA